MTTVAFDRGLWTYRARLVRVVDGDTVVLLIDTGFGVRYEAHVRIRGIDAPELPTAQGIAAADHLVRGLAQGVGSWPLRVSTQKTTGGDDVRSFSRYIGTVWTVGLDGTLTDVADWMIRAEHAERITAGGRDAATGERNDLGGGTYGGRWDRRNRGSGSGR